MTTYRVNTYLAVLIVTIVGSMAAMTIVHVAQNTTYDIATGMISTQHHPSPSALRAAANLDSSLGN